MVHCRLLGIWIISYEAKSYTDYRSFIEKLLLIFYIFFWFWKISCCFFVSIKKQCEYNKKRCKKVQDRYKVDFVYIVDSNQVSDNEKALGLNCPNCGAPISDVGVKTCKYCGSGALEIVNRVWTFNNIENY